MIVDDEPLVRLGLEAMIEWEQLGYELIPHASNGQEAIEKIINNKPDVVITDIKMPVMDGIEMIEQCQKLGFDIKFIILSSYDDFHLVKKVMKLGAIDYLIKLNLNENELTQLMLKVKKELSIQKEASSKDKSLKEYLISNKKTLKQDFVRKLMFGNMDLSNTEKISKSIKELNIDEEMTYILCYIKLSNYETNQEEKMSEMTSFYVVNLCNDILLDFRQGHVYLRTERELVVFIEYSKEDVINEKREKSGIIRLCERFLQMIKQYFNKTAVIGISSMHYNIKDANKAFNESVKATKLIITDEQMPIYFYTDKVKHYEKKDSKIDILDLKDKLIIAIDTGDEALLTQIFKEIYNRFKYCVSRQNAYEICYKLVYIITVLEPNGEMIMKQIFDKDYTIFENIQAFTTINEVVVWISQVEKGIKEFINKKYLDVADIKVKKAKQYILQNVYNKITLSQVAEELEISSGYLSTIFKKSEGKSFSDYVAEVKINKAKQLLKEYNYKIYEVSSKLGYEDPYYFSKLFKKISSMTPTEYICKG